MPQVTVFDMTGKSVGEMTLSDAIFGIEPNTSVMHAAVVNYLANQRQGTQSTLTRSEVSGGGRKPWKQKGTGRARQGSIRAPQWYHGGVAHGPVPRDYSQRTPKKMKAAALRYALSDRANNGRVAVVDFQLDAPSTKKAIAALAPVVADNFTTVVLSRDSVNEWLSVRNIPTVYPIFADQLNTYDVITAQYVVFSKDGLEAFVAAKTAAKEA